ncbi:MAG: hypothetical protein FWF76_00030 [Oscillospiraceae bacterium]|nr:hypothetical protein [Oscillospiraceae bacterium]
MSTNIKNTNKRISVYQNLLLFTAGGIIYGAMEVVYREYTHISMFITGGLCFLLIGAIRHLKRDIPVTVRMLMGALMITLLEFICGLIVNLWLELDVWCYAHERANLLGQICLHASAIWFFLSFLAVYLDIFMRKRMFGEPTAPIRILP